MAKMLWKPSQERIKNSNMYKFMLFINEKCGTNFTEYGPLYQWSVDNIPEFRASIRDFSEIKASKGYEKLVDDLNKFPGTSWFVGTRLSFAENPLSYRDDHTAQ